MSSTPLIDDAETGGGNGASGPLQGVDYGAFDDAGDDHVAKYDDASADASAAAKGGELRTVQALVDDNIIAEDSYSVCEHDEDLGGGGDVDDTRRLFSSMQLSSHAPGTRLIGYGHGAELLSSPAAAANGVLESSEACCEYAWRVGAVIETEVRDIVADFVVPHLGLETESDGGDGVSTPDDAKRYLVSYRCRGSRC